MSCLMRAEDPQMQISGRFPIKKSLFEGKQNLQSTQSHSGNTGSYKPEKDNKIGNRQRGTG